jgi:hypothetical protein
VVGDGDRRHPELGNPAAELRKPVGAVEQGVLAVKMEMDEVAGHGTILSQFVAKESPLLLSRNAALPVGP